MGVVRILMLEDSALDCDLEMANLERGGLECRIRRVETRDGFERALESTDIEIILADYSLPEFDGISALAIASSRRPELPFIFVSGTMGEEVAIDCLHRGATDYVLKQKLDRLAPAVRRALSEAAERRERRRAEEERNTLLLRERAARAEAEEKARELASANEALLRSNQELEQFAYAASHDLREPLRTIKSFTQLLARKYAGKIDAEADEYIRFVEDGVERMHQLIRDLLEYSRVVHGAVEPRVAVDANAALRNALLNLAGMQEKAGALIEWDPLPTVWADPVRLAQVFQNLLENSLKYVDGQPPRVHVSARLEPREWVFSVADNGIGFEPEHASRIFGLFRRLHRDRYPGTGVGLAICKRIIEEHGGRIWAESEPGRGATFYFTLPSEKPEDADQSKAPDCSVSTTSGAGETSRTGSS